MKLSTKGRYAARAMLELALNYGEEPVLLDEIAKRQGISKKYLERLLLTLKIAGLVKSIRGAHGGYILSRSPSEIKLSEIVLASEGSLAPVECVDDPNVCNKALFCVTRDIWKEIKEAMMKILESTSLEDMIKQQKQKESYQVMMYHI
jgi:Rrf2 family protein